MAWNYHRRVKVIPGVYLNFSKKGVSTSIGIRGASVTFSKNGTYLNQSIPGTGIYQRRKIGSKGNSPHPQDNPINNLTVPSNIFSADVQEITSEGLQGVKEAIIAASEQRDELKKDLIKVKKALSNSKLNLMLVNIFLLGFIFKKLTTSLREDIANQNEAISQITDQENTCYVPLDIDFEPEIEEKYTEMVEAFKNLMKSQKIWDLTGEIQQDKIAARSNVSTIINRKQIALGIKPLEDIHSRYDPLWLQNANGADLYLYPNFLVMFSSKDKFALIDIEDIQLTHTWVSFNESLPVPGDSQIIDKTWTKVNKDGQPDRRFKDNPEIPIVRYGEIIISSDSGINEKYMFSNYEYCEAFGLAFNNFRNMVKIG